MKISVIGSGYVGTVAGACFAEKGNYVYLVDNKIEIVKSLNSGKTHIYEPGLEELLKEGIKKEKILATTDLEYAVKDSLVSFIAVPTPSNDGGSVDLSYIKNVANEIGKSLKGRKFSERKIIVLKSTAPPGTTGIIKEIIKKYDINNINLASCPEFLKEGNAVEDFRKPERIVIGVEDDYSFEILKKLHEPFVRTGNPIIKTSIESAQIGKYGSNLQLAVRITVMNELSRLSEYYGADIDEVRMIIGSDDRIGKHFLFPGPGYGGSCFPKDIYALNSLSNEAGITNPIINAVNKSNEIQKEFVVKKIYKELGNNLDGKVITIWGLTFKPKTDDIRDSPALYIINKIIENGGRIIAYDPEEKARNKVIDIYNKNKNVEVIKHYSLLSPLYKSIRNSDALLIVTDWDDFKGIDLEKVKKELRNPLIIDSRNLYNSKDVEKAGIKYIPLGKPKTYLE